jgi:hypothetical protein
MRFIRDDGGRAAAGFKGQASDCVARAVAIAARRPYAAVYGELALVNAGMRETRGRLRSGWQGEITADRGIYTTSLLFKRYMAGLGFVWTPTMLVGKGCRVHLRPGELPPGRLVVKVSRHLTAVIDGVLHDTKDCSRQGDRCVYGYWRHHEGSD